MLKQIRQRIKSFEGKMAGESNFYCSDLCKNSCELYSFMPGIQIDPRSIKYIEKGEIMTTRNCQNDMLKQSQCDDNLNQSYCEKCGDFIDVELHHTLLVSKYGKDSINSAGHILLCPGCHVGLHGKCGELK